LKKKQFQEITKHCQEEYPKEACGILAGRYVGEPSVPEQGEDTSGTVEKVYRMRNISENPETCYFMEPKEQLRVFKEMGRLGIEMLGIYHSHSGTSAYPSKLDCEMAFYPEASYVIISLQDFNNPDVHAFRIIESRIQEEKIVVRKEGEWKRNKR
jgi:proteasome lid subunit RPN8/RPN11